MGNRKGRWSAGAIALAAVLAGTFLACKKEEKKRAVSAVPVSSSVLLRTEGDGIHLTTATAEFVLTGNGGLLGRLRDGTAVSTIDEAQSEGGIAVESGKGAVNDFVRDLKGAEIREAAGKLGSRG
jgi:hypothetical protein